MWRLYFLDLTFKVNIKTSQTQIQVKKLAGNWPFHKNLTAHPDDRKSQENPRDWESLVKKNYKKSTKPFKISLSKQFGSPINLNNLK